MTKMEEFVHRPVSAWAMRFQGGRDSADQILEWARSNNEDIFYVPKEVDGSNLTDFLIVPVLGVDAVLWPQCWLVQHEDGSLAIMDSRSFAEHFEIKVEKPVYEPTSSLVKTLITHRQVSEAMQFTGGSENAELLRNWYETQTEHGIAVWIPAWKNFSETIDFRKFREGKGELRREGPFLELKVGDWLVRYGDDGGWGMMTKEGFDDTYLIVKNPASVFEGTKK